VGSITSAARQRQLDTHKAEPRPRQDRGVSNGQGQARPKGRPGLNLGNPNAQQAAPQQEAPDQPLSHGTRRGQQGKVIGEAH
jgi:hypothetical protein